MIDQPEPMTTLDPDEWRAYKRATRTFRHQRRIQTESASELRRRSVAWDLAVERDDRTDPAMVESTNFVEVAEQVSV